VPDAHLSTEDMTRKGYVMIRKRQKKMLVLMELTFDETDNKSYQ